MREYRTPGGHHTAAGHPQEHLPQPENIHRAHCEFRPSYKSAQTKATPSGMTASTYLTPTRGSSPLPTPKFVCTSISKLGFMAIQNQLRDEHIGGMQLN